METKINQDRSQWASYQTKATSEFFFFAPRKKYGWGCFRCASQTLSSGRWWKVNTPCRSVFTEIKGFGPKQNIQSLQREKVYRQMQFMIAIYTRNSQRNTAGPSARLDLLRKWFFLLQVSNLSGHTFMLWRTVQEVNLIGFYLEKCANRVTDRNWSRTPMQTKYQSVEHNSAAHAHANRAFLKWSWWYSKKHLILYQNDFFQNAIHNSITQIFFFPSDKFEVITWTY